jgi:hypothetical protein
MIEPGTEGTYGPEGVAVVLTGNGLTTSDPGDTALEAPLSSGRAGLGPVLSCYPSALAQYHALFLFPFLFLPLAMY